MGTLPGEECLRLRDTGSIEHNGPFTAWNNALSSAVMPEVAGSAIRRPSSRSSFPHPPPS